MNRSEYKKGVRELRGLYQKAERACTVAIHTAYVKAYKPFIEGLRRGVITNIDKEGLQESIKEIIRTTGARPAEAARELYRELEASLRERLKIPLKSEPSKLAARLQNGRRRDRALAVAKPNKLDANSDLRLQKNARTSFKRSRYTGKVFGYRMEGGRVVWDDRPLEALFAKRADLSERVWNDVENQVCSPK